VVRLELRN